MRPEVFQRIEHVLEQTADRFLPYLLGKELWRETRIPLFEQATDTRGEELKEELLAAYFTLLGGGRGCGGGASSSHRPAPTRSRPGRTAGLRRPLFRSHAA